MDSWFSRPSNDDPRVGVPLVAMPMSWALGFARAKEVYDEIVTGELWVNQAARKQIRAMLTAHGKLGPKAVTFGDELNSSAPDAVKLHKDYIQYRSVEQSLFTGADDMVAALANFNFRVVVGGDVKPTKTGHEISIKKLGIYLQDSYDFNGDQTLGYWSDDDFQGYFNPIGGDHVTNADFRAWRNANGRGGDYYVYSDVKVLHRKPADTFAI
jgi:hypothetical protein